jgi:hypothetical protein
LEFRNTATWVLQCGGAILLVHSLLGVRAPLPEPPEQR